MPGYTRTMKSTLSVDDVVVASSRQVSSRLGDDTVVLELDKGIYFELDPVGSRIWELVTEPRRVTEIRDTIVGEYEVEPDRCETDLLALLADLLSRGLVEVVDAQAP